MVEQRSTQTITSQSDRQKSVPVVTVESFYNSHAEKLQMKLEGPRVGFHRKIREPTINRPGLALSGFYTYFAEKRVQVLGAAEHSYLKSLPSKTAHQAISKIVRAQNPVPGHVAGLSSCAGVVGVLPRRQKSRCFGRR